MTLGTSLFGCPLQDRALVFRVEGARDALRDFEAGIGATDRTGLFAFTGDPRDHRPKTVGPRYSYSLKNERAKSDVRLGGLGGRIEERVLAKFDWAVGSDKVGPSRKALVMEKSQASWPPLGPEGPRRLPGDERRWRGSGGSGSGGRSSSTGSRGISRPSFSRTVERLALSLAAEWTTSRVKLWRGTRSPPHPQTRVWSHHLSMTCPQSVQFVSWDQMGMQSRRRKLTRNEGAGMWDSRESGRAKSHAPAPGMRLRRRWARRDVVNSATSAFIKSLSSCANRSSRNGLSIAEPCAISSRRGLYRPTVSAPLPANR